MKILPALHGKKDVSKKKVFERGSSLHSDDFDDWDSRFMLRSDLDDFGRNDEVWGQRGWFKPSCVPITIILILIVLVVLLPLIDNAERSDHVIQNDWLKVELCRSSCRFTLVESIPQGMSYRNGSTPFPSTFKVWSDMIKEANKSLEIASYYWTLRDKDVHSHYFREDGYKYPGSDEGEKIFQNILEAGTQRKLLIKVAQEQPSQEQPNTDTEYLQKEKAIQLQSVNFNKLVGSGILHTKLWITDRQNFYVGSANMDWRSLTQVKELGIYVQNCSCLAEDVAKIFDVYWYLGDKEKIPSHWPRNFTTRFNMYTPMKLYINNVTARIYASSSPPPFCPKERTKDSNAIVDVIRRAEKYIYIAVMDYYPLILYEKKLKYWAIIDDALRAAAVDNKIEIRLLISWWDHSRQSEKYFLRSLTLLTDVYPGVRISCKLFVVPSSTEQSKIPFARVNHNKYMVTDKAALIGTSNWSGDYFTVTGGMSLVIEGKTEIRDQLEQIFLRDWNSEFTYDLPR
ncbi:5'-3' exonuclease PLD3-like isoform X2 [Lycorma delicatula]|uniref:5'-3' exonuclease PLD3-like isoform X2 n=1 Tax=Lycorma delicatula TaxID=130591 RepID=UPI003F519149